MADAIIEELKHYFVDGSVPPQNVLQDIFQQKSGKLLESLAENGPLDGSLRREAIEEAVKLLYESNTEQAREISNKLGLSTEDFLELAKIAFDIAVNQKNPESQFEILSGFILDQRRISSGVLSYIGHLINNAQFNKASEIKKKYRESIRKNDLETKGREFFEEAMSFETDDEKRDYLPAQKIRDIFKVDKAIVQKHALAQYDYNLTHDRQEEALEVARLFNLAGDKVIQASKTLFIKKFDDFAEALYEGKYKGSIELNENDPYRQALDNVIQNKFLTTPGQKIADEIQNKAFALLSRLNTYTEGSDIEPGAKLFFAIALISDYQLLQMSNHEASSQCMDIAKSIIEDMEEQMTFVDEAVSSYGLFYDLYKQASTLRPSIRILAQKMFSLFLDTDRTKMVTQTVQDFELKSGDIIPLVKKKFLDLLEADKMEDLRKLENSFPSIDKLRSDNDFMMKAFHIFEHCVSEVDIPRARTIQKLLKFSPQRTAMPLKLILRGLMRREQYDEAAHIIQAFRVNKNNIRDLLLQTYERELEKGSQEAGFFREKFNLSAGDVGLIRWLLKEVLNF